jgi:hypothetical protein
MAQILLHDLERRKPVMGTGHPLTDQISPSDSNNNFSCSRFWDFVLTECVDLLRDSNKTITAVHPP